jgi:ribonuclease-3
MTTARKTPAKKTKSAKPKLAADLLALQKKLGHTFAQPALLELSLTHRSHTYEARNGVPAVILPAHPEQRDQRNAPGSDNEQLEFLGDAVIGLVVTEALFREFPHCSEGELTRLRSHLVSRKRLAAMGLDLGLGQALRLGKSSEQNGGREKPAMIANATEAVVAAVYLDAAAQDPASALPAIRALAARYLLEPELPTLRAALREDLGRGALRDHKTLLQERVQALNAGRLRYVDTAQSGPAHLRSFTVEAQLEAADGNTRTLASAEGSSKKEAQQRAAALALEAWQDPA